VHRKKTALDKRAMALAIHNSKKVDKKLIYNDFEQFVKKIKLAAFTTWVIETSQNYVLFKVIDGKHFIPEIELHVDESLAYTIRAYGWRLPDTHQIYKSNLRSVRYTMISQFLNQIRDSYLCNGISSNEIENFSLVKKHVVSKLFSIDDESCDDGPTNETVYFRSSTCNILQIESGICKECKILTINSSKAINAKKKILNTPASIKAPVKYTAPERLLLTLQNQRSENRYLKKQISELRQAIEKNAVSVGENIHQDLQKIINSFSENVNLNREISSFMKLFFSEQLKYLTEHPSQTRYHPMIIKYSLALYAKSPAAYDLLRLQKGGKGILVLPSQRTLRDYRNYIKPQRGFNSQYVQELAKLVSNFSALERYIILSFDEMKIQNDLVWDKHTGDLIGFVDLGDDDLTQATFEKTDTLASHILVFFIRSAMNPLSYAFASFATDSIMSFQIFPLFWRAVAILERTCKLKVVAVTCDGASPNHAFYKMHVNNDNKANGITYRTKNIYAEDERYIWFFSDPPHLIKTSRNCLSNSGSNRCSRYMWNNGKYLLWSHIAKFYYEDMECNLNYFPKLTREHIILNAYSVMNVKLAVQILSATVGNTLLEFGPGEASETANFCLLMDKFFDCCNVTNTKEYIKNRKVFLKPFTDCSDERFYWLKNNF
jgi:hypothetical protein